MRDDPRPTSFALRAAERGVSQQRRDGGNILVGLVAIERDECAARGGEQLALPADVGGDGGQRHGHGLKQRQGDALISRWQQEAIGGGEQFGDAGVWLRAEQADAGEGMVGDEALHGWALRAIAGHQADEAVAGGLKPQRDLQQQQWAFLLVEPGREQDDRHVLVDAERCADRGAVVATRIPLRRVDVGGADADTIFVASVLWIVRSPGCRVAGSPRFELAFDQPAAQVLRRDESRIEVGRVLDRVAGVAAVAPAVLLDMDVVGKDYARTMGAEEGQRQVAELAVGDQRVGDRARARDAQDGVGERGGTGWASQDMDIVGDGGELIAPALIADLGGDDRHAPAVAAGELRDEIEVELIGAAECQPRHEQEEVVGVCDHKERPRLILALGSDKDTYCNYCNA